MTRHHPALRLCITWGGCPNLERGRPRGDPRSELFSPQEPGNGLGEGGERADTGPAVPPNHHQRLEHIVRRAVVEDKVRGLEFLISYQRVPWLLETGCLRWYLFIFSTVSFK